MRKCKQKFRYLQILQFDFDDLTHLRLPIQQRFSYYIGSSTCVTPDNPLGTIFGLCIPALFDTDIELLARNIRLAAHF